jgi:hypothetical protein
LTNPNPKCLRVEDRDVPVPRRLELAELVVMPVLPESDPVRDEDAPMMREAAPAAISAGMTAPLGASPQRSQKPWSMNPPHPGYWHFCTGIFHRRETRR